MVAQRKKAIESRPVHKPVKGGLPPV